LFAEVQQAIKKVNAQKAKTKTSEEKTMRGKLLYNPRTLNDFFKKEFSKFGW
jgi:hypothetical protein